MRAADLYQEHAPFVGRLCRSLLRDAGEAEDASQQTFLAAYRAILNGTEPREPAAWLATIARNECIARVRGRMREPLPSDVEPSEVSPDVHVEAVRNEHRSELAEALATLPAQQREAVLLRDVRGFSYEEVAASLAVSTSAVESLLFRARSRLRSQLRTAYAAFSGAGWLGPLRELLGSGGLAGAPVAAKAVAVGALGAAAVAGGVVAPTMLQHRPHSSPPPPRRPAAQTQPAPQAQQAAVPPVVFSSARPSLSDRPLVEDVSAVSGRPAGGRGSDGVAGSGDGATGEHQGGNGATGEHQGGESSSSGLQGGSVSAGGESGGSGGESRTHSGGSGESGRITKTSSSSEESSPTQTVPAPVERSSAGSGSSAGAGDSSGQPSGQSSGDSSSSGLSVSG
ncbi:MAG TPA: RNA polymerase sigma factor, partial [Gaiellaceae bacterium]|nr:RNA polymerase sigma factor [Gaiellaceae bacterium]